ncbi:MAG TPA: hypothetical protein VIT65_23170 [Microlunatus sp.]
MTDEQTTRAWLLQWREPGGEWALWMTGGPMPLRKVLNEYRREAGHLEWRIVKQTLTEEVLEW